MLILIYKIVGRHTRSILDATLVDEIEVEEMPRDPDRFAKKFGGDFIEVAELVGA